MELLRTEIAHSDDNSGGVKILFLKEQWSNRLGKVLCSENSVWVVVRTKRFPLSFICVGK